MEYQYARLTDGNIIEIEMADEYHIEGAAVAFCGWQDTNPCYEPLRAEDRQDDDGETYPVLIVSVPILAVDAWWSAKRFAMAAERGFHYHLG